MNQSSRATDAPAASSVASPVAGEANDFSCRFSSTDVFADTDFRFRFAETARVGDEETGRACMLFRFDLPSKRSARSFRSVGTNILDECTS